MMTRRLTAIPVQVNRLDSVEVEDESSISSTPRWPDLDENESGISTEIEIPIVDVGSGEFRLVVREVDDVGRLRSASRTVSEGEAMEQRNDLVNLSRACSSSKSLDPCVAQSSDKPCE